MARHHQRVLRQRLAPHEHPEAVADALEQVPRSGPSRSPTWPQVALPDVVVADRDEADPGHPLEVGEAYAELIPGARLVVEEEGKSPIAWQGGQLSQRHRRARGARGMSARVIFTRDGAAFVPTTHAVGPWDPGQLHGGAASALVARALQELAPEQQLARCTFEFLGPVPLAPLEISTQIVKPGARFQLAEAELVAGGRPVLLARAVLLRRAEAMELPDQARWPDGLPCEGPQDSVALPSGWRSAGDEQAFHLTGMELRFGGGTRFGGGRSLAWFRLAGALVAGGQTPPAARAIAAADFGNGVSHVLDFRTHLFVNTDLTVTLLRDPVGPWVLLDARSRIDAAGIGWASSTLYDQDGPVGFSQQTLFVQAR